LKVLEPKGLVLSTVDLSGKPSSRVVFLKNLDENGAIFASRQSKSFQIIHTVGVDPSNP